MGGAERHPASSRPGAPEDTRLICSIPQGQHVLRIKWGMSKDRDTNPRSSLAKDREIWAKIKLN